MKYRICKSHSYYIEELKSCLFFKWYSVIRESEIEGLPGPTVYFNTLGDTKKYIETMKEYNTYKIIEYID